MHILIEQSLYGKPETEGATDEESDFHEFGGCKMFTISHLSTTAYTAECPKRDTMAKGKKEINTALENRCLLCFCLTDKNTAIERGSVSNSVVKSGRSSRMASVASRTFSNLIGSKTLFFFYHLTHIGHHN